MTAYWVADVPGETLDLPFPDDIHFEPATVTAILTDPHGEVVTDGAPSVAIVGADEGRSLVVTWAAMTPFETPGQYSLQLTFTGAAVGGVTPVQRTDPEMIVVQQNDGWHTLESARRMWADAPFSDEELFELLDSAKTAVVDFAPVYEFLPPRYVRAQLMQARAVWNATKAGSENEIGPDGFSTTVYPLDKNIRQLLRPRRGISEIW